MNKTILLIFFCFSFFLYSFSNKKEDKNLTIENLKSAESFVEATEFLKLKVNSPRLFDEYVADKKNKCNLIETENKKIIFIPNKGQIIDSDRNLRPDILYKASLNGVDLYLTNNGMSFVFYKYEDKPQNLATGEKEIIEELHSFRDDPMKDKVVKMYRMDLDIIGMNSNLSTLNEEQTQEYFNYYYAHCPEGITNMHGFRKVTYKNVYDNIDIVFHSNENGLKYDFIVKPGGNVSDIKLKYENEGEVHVTEEGKVRAINPFGELETDAPFTYQSDGKVIVSYYEINTDGILSIKTAEYDRIKDLIIDPYIGATYYGGYEPDFGSYSTNDNHNNILVTGDTYSTDFPTLNPGGGAYYQGNTGHDAFIIKFNSFGVRKWATNYGGGVSDFGSSIATDNTNNILVTGNTRSSNFPLQDKGGGAYFQGIYSGGFCDAFILKFDSSGVRLWATFYSGNNQDYGNSITTGENDDILITGQTYSLNFPLWNPGGGIFYQRFCKGASDAFILKFDSSGVRQWATYYGGNDQDYGNSITTDENDNILITGTTDSYNFPVLNPGGGTYFQGLYSGGICDAFILKFNFNGVRQWATYYGGDSWDVGNSITIDENNNILVTGYTWSYNFPVFNPGGGAYFQDTLGGVYFYDVFILKFNTSGIRQWATYYGGSDYDYGNSITADHDNNILITGETYSTNFPVFDPGGGAYFQNSLCGLSDLFVLKFNTGGVRQLATYYGGDGWDKGRSITTDSYNNILITGTTFSRNFPVFDPGGGAYFQGTNSGLYYSDVFIIGLRPTGIISNINILHKSNPKNQKLYYNYPNPFNPKTKIRFDLHKTFQAKLIVYDILGKEVTTLVDERLKAGTYEVEFDGARLPSGVYFYKLETDEFVNAKKMLLVK